MTYDAACRQGATEILGMSIIMGALRSRQKNLHCVHLMASFLPHVTVLKSVSCLI